MKQMHSPKNEQELSELLKNNVFFQAFGIRENFHYRVNGVMTPEQKRDFLPYALLTGWYFKREREDAH